MPGFRVSLVGIELVTVEARVVVASIATYLGYSDALALTQVAAAPQTVDPRQGCGKNVSLRARPGKGRPIPCIAITG
jgi:hypothetical protein